MTSYATRVPVSPRQSAPPSTVGLASRLLSLDLGHTLPLALFVFEHSGRTDVQQADLGQILGASERTVRRWELALERAGLLLIERHKASNRRTLTLAGPVDNVWADCGQPGETGHERPDTRDRTRDGGIHRIAGARARAEDSLSVSSTRTRERALVDNLAADRLNRGASTPVVRFPTWSGPSSAVDQAIRDVHAKWSAWPNVLREWVLLGRDLVHAWGETHVLRYLANLERHIVKKVGPVPCAVVGTREDRRPGMFVGGLRARVAETALGDRGQGELFT